MDWTEESGAPTSSLLLWFHPDLSPPHPGLLEGSSTYFEVSTLLLNLPVLDLGDSEKSPPCRPPRVNGERCFGSLRFPRRRTPSLPPPTSSRVGEGSDSPFSVSPRRNSSPNFRPRTLDPWTWSLKDRRPNTGRTEERWERDRTGPLDLRNRSWSPLHPYVRSRRQGRRESSVNGRPSCERHFECPVQRTIAPPPRVPGRQ